MFYVQTIANCISKMWYTVYIVFIPLWSQNINTEKFYTLNYLIEKENYKFSRSHIILDWLLSMLQYYIIGLLLLMHEYKNSTLMKKLVDV